MVPGKIAPPTPTAAKTDVPCIKMHEVRTLDHRYSQKTRMLSQNPRSRQLIDSLEHRISEQGTHFVRFCARCSTCPSTSCAPGCTIFASWPSCPLPHGPTPSCLEILTAWTTVDIKRKSSFATRVVVRPHSARFSWRVYARARLKSYCKRPRIASRPFKGGRVFSSFDRYADSSRPIGVRRFDAQCPEGLN